jgi:hypothetical protein
VSAIISSNKPYPNLVTFVPVPISLRQAVLLNGGKPRHRREISGTGVDVEDDGPVRCWTMYMKLEAMVWMTLDLVVSKEEEENEYSQTMGC